MVDGDQGPLHRLALLASPSRCPARRCSSTARRSGSRENLEIPTAATASARRCSGHRERHRGFRTGGAATSHPAWGRRRGVTAEPVTPGAQRRDAGLAAELDGAVDPPPPRAPRARLGRHERCSTPAIPRSSPHRADRDGGTVARRPFARRPPRSRRASRSSRRSCRQSTSSTASTRRPGTARSPSPLDPYGARWFRLRRDGAAAAATP